MSDGRTRSDRVRPHSAVPRRLRRGARRRIAADRSRDGIRRNGNHRMVRIGLDRPGRRSSGSRFQRRNGKPTWWVNRCRAIAMTRASSLSTSRPASSATRTRSPRARGAVQHQPLSRRRPGGRVRRWAGIHARTTTWRPHPDQAGLTAFVVPMVDSPALIELSGRTESDYGLDATSAPIFHVLPIPGSNSTSGACRRITATTRRGSSRPWKASGPASAPTRNRARTSPAHSRAFRRFPTWRTRHSAAFR